MLCENCKQKEAKVYMTKVINGIKTEMNLCQSCASEQGFFNASPVSFTDFFQGILDMTPGMDTEFVKDSNNSSVHNVLKCSKCGLTYDEFKKTSKLGCIECFNLFRSNLEPIIKSMQANLHHTGKYPKRLGGSLLIKKQIGELKRKIAVCVQDEEYEGAATLRDQIRKLEEELKNE